jgi:hypothetical protein
MFGLDPRQLAAVLELAQQLLVELRRLNDNLEAQRDQAEDGGGE